MECTSKFLGSQAVAVLLLKGFAQQLLATPKLGCAFQRVLPEGYMQCKHETPIIVLLSSGADVLNVLICTTYFE